MTRLIFFSLLVMTISCTAKSTDPKKSTPKSVPVTQELLVKFVEETPQIEIDKIITTCSGTVVKHLEGINVFHIKISTSTSEGISCFQKNASVKYAEPNRVVKIYK